MARCNWPAQAGRLIYPDAQTAAYLMTSSDREIPLVSAIPVIIKLGNWTCANPNCTFPTENVYCRAAIRFFDLRRADRVNIEG